MDLLIDSAGEVRCLYSEAIALAQLGALSIRRASHVEPDAHGHWHVDLAPVSGPVLGPFRERRHALDAEEAWLLQHRLLTST